MSADGVVVSHEVRWGTTTFWKIAPNAEFNDASSHVLFGGNDVVLYQWLATVDGVESVYTAFADGEIYKDVHLHVRVLSVAPFNNRIRIELNDDDGEKLRESREFTVVGIKSAESPPKSAQ